MRRDRCVAMLCWRQPGTAQGRLSHPPARSPPPPGTFGISGAQGRGTLSQTRLCKTHKQFGCSQKSGAP